MAGPASSILFETILSPSAWAETERVMLEISSEVEGTGFWVTSTAAINGTVQARDGRPFGMEKNAISPGGANYAQEELAMIKALVGFEPTFEVSICAFCNREIDHQILGELTLYLAEKFGGVVDFGGQISPPLAPMNGKLWEIPYATAEGSQMTYSVADVTFMRHWLSDPNFSMVK
ncbi:MAG: DUF6368 family protein [Bacteroidota bacterium]